MSIKIRHCKGNNLIYILFILILTIITQRSHDVCCDNCQHNVAVFFQAEQQAKSTALYLIYVCCKCGYKWMDE